MEENANKFGYFQCSKYGVFVHTDCEKIFHVTFFYIFTIVINL